MGEIGYRTGAARVVFDTAGVVAAFATAAQPDATYLTSAGAVTARLDGHDVAWGAVELGVDVDELEVTREAGPGLRATVRHTFDPMWTVRLRLVNLSAAPIRLDDVTLGWRSAPGHGTVVLTGGTVGAYTVQPVSGRGPVLVGRLVSGEVATVDHDGWHLGPVRLEPGASRVVQWRWETSRTARQAGRPGALPATTWFDLAQPVTLPAGPDVAVLAPGLAVDSGADAVELAAVEPGSYAVELRSARGTTRLALDWAPDLWDLVDAAAGRALHARAGRAGVPRLPGPAAGLLVQEALARQVVDDPVRAEDALELLAGDLLEAEPPTPLALAFLAREADRTGEATGLARAEGAVLAATGPAPGLGLAATQVCLALVRSGRPVAAVTRHLSRLARHPVAVGSGPGAVAATLELRLLTRPRDADLPGDGAVRAGEVDLTDPLLRLGVALGAGLLGRTLDPLPVDVLAHLAAVLALVPEAVGHELQAWWGISAAELTRRSAAEARCRVGPPAGAVTVAVDEALGWLVLAASLT